MCCFTYPLLYLCYHRTSSCSLMIVIILFIFTSNNGSSSHNCSGFKNLFKEQSFVKSMPVHTIEPYSLFKWYFCNLDWSCTHRTHLPVVHVCLTECVRASHQCKLKYCNLYIHKDIMFCIWLNVFDKTNNLHFVHTKSNTYILSSLFSINPWASWKRLSNWVIEQNSWRKVINWWIINQYVFIFPYLFVLHILE